MNICIDARPLLGKRTGIGNYTFNLIKHISECSEDIKIKCFMSSLKAMRINPFKNYGNIRSYRYLFPNKYLNYLWSYTDYPKIQWLVGKTDIVHSTNYYYIPHGKESSHITTVHDINFLKYNEFAHNDIKSILSKKLGLFLKCSSFIIVPTNAVKSDILNYFNFLNEDQIKIIHYGIEVEKEDCPLSSIIDGEYILSVGSFIPRKNFNMLIEAFMLLSDSIFKNFKLVIGGMLDNETRGNAPKLRERNVILLDYISQKDLQNLYCFAKLFVLPSIDEGFGFPVLEAQSYGIPVVISDIPVFREIALESALFFDPCNKDEIAGQISKCLFDTDLQKDLISKGYENINRFDWTKCAEDHMEVYKRCL